jgi:pimeloyl-ACP methyl ester carboxylesterase
MLESMMALMTLAGLAVELALYAAAARGLGLPLACALLGPVLARAAVVALLCALSRSHPRIILRETRALLFIYTWGLLAQRWLAPRDPARVLPGVLPVLFVHGIYCNAGVWHRQLRALRGLDNLFTVNLEPPLAGLDHFAQQLDQRLQEICRATGSARAILVAHSMGGMVARAHLARLKGGERIARLVTLGSPHHGSRILPGAPGRCAGEMRWGCGWLAQLAEDEARCLPVPLTSIYSDADEFVAPQDSARLPGANNIRLEGKGHLELLASPEVHRLVAAEIAAARGARPS